MKFRHIILLAVLLFIFIARWRPDSFFTPRPPVPDAATGVRITQFYAAQAKIPRGEKTLLCYGVEQATRVRLTPAVEDVWPAVTRCFDIAPAHTTKYVFTAQDDKGAVVSESLTVEVGPGRTKILEVSIDKLEVRPGEEILLCFKAVNASNYDVGKLRPAMTAKGPILPTPERGCFNDRPAKTKTYVVKVSGPGGSDSESVTVKVK
jgi:hypothetical protein